MTTMMDLSMLDTVWGLPGPWRVEPLARGTNNRVERVETAAGSYVLRVYSNHADPGRVELEQRILAALQAQHLPFAVPAAIPTRTGEPYARIQTAESASLAVLTPLIPGTHPGGEDLAQAEAAGEALGRLDEALAQVRLADDEAALTWRSFGDLARCHPLVPDPPAAIAALPVPEETRRRLLARYAWLMSRIPALYASLPQQLVHEDCDLSNVLMDGARVTGILDFEFCTRDVRAMDLTVALVWWLARALGTGDEWPIIQALAQGYARRITLDTAEIAAIPVLYELRAYTSLIHRLGRHRQGLSPLEAVIERAEVALERADWLRQSGGRFGAVLRACF